MLYVVDPEMKIIFSTTLICTICSKYYYKKISSMFKLNNKTKNRRRIYSIICIDCEKKYIEEADNFQRRIYQHEYRLKFRDANSALLKHEKDHKIEIDTSE